MKTDLAHLKQKLCVVCLKKDKTILCHAEAEHSEVTVNNTIPEPNFTVEQILLFKKRFENGYDLYVDPDYVAWLRLYHPSSLPEELSSAEGATSSVKSSRLEEEMELSSLSQKSPIRSTPIRGQDEPPDVSKSPAQNSPVEEQNMTP